MCMYTHKHLKTYTRLTNTHTCIYLWAIWLMGQGHVPESHLWGHTSVDGRVDIWQISKTVLQECFYLCDKTFKRVLMKNVLFPSECSYAQRMTSHRSRDISTYFGSWNEVDWSILFSTLCRVECYMSQRNKWPYVVLNVTCFSETSDLMSCWMLPCFS